MSELVWIASYPKSGNTWVRAFLANYCFDRDRPVPINGLSRCALGDSFLSHYASVGKVPEAALNETRVLTLRPRVLRWLVESAAGQVFVKTHHANTAVDGAPLFQASFPQRAIYIVRDPLDIAVAYASFLGQPVAAAIEALCDGSREIGWSKYHSRIYLRDWSTHVGSWTDESAMPLHLVRYEDMSESPARTFGDIVRFLGLPYDDGRLAKAIRFSSFEELSGQEKMSEFRESPREQGTPFFRLGKPGNWRTALGHADIEKIVTRHGRQMLALGYSVA